MQFRITSLAIAILVLGHKSIAQSTYHWSQCKQRVLDIQTGKLTLGSIDNETLDEYLYHGEVVGLDKGFPRDEYLAVTYQGCLAICDNPIAFYEPQTALSLASNWIFPLAILLNLPWESLHTGKLSHTLLTALNWLGSPQTALTATTFNIHQLRRAYLRTRVQDNDLLYLYTAIYYVLSCIDHVLISRWLYNINAVKTWAARNETDPSLICWWRVGDEIPECFRVRNFVGQGRELGYCGLLHAGLESSESVRFRPRRGTNQLNITDEISLEVAKTLSGGKPTTWYIAAFTSLLLIWTAVLSALTVSYYAPTVGLHCRPLTYLLFGGFSSVSWVIQVLKRPPRWLVWISRTFNGLAVLTLVVAIVIQLTGITSNCFCRSSAVNLGYAGAYLDFEGFTFYRRHFNVDPFWIGATVVGGTVPAITLVVAVFWWLSCKSLWRADENEAGRYAREGVEDCVDTRWLQ